MKVTPLDLRQQRFKTAMRGYDKGEVDSLLTEAAEDYETALRENDRLRQDVARLDNTITEHRTQERNLRNTLMTAQKLADDIREDAQEDAARIVREAEARADLVMQKAQARLDEYQREIEGLRMRRRETESSLEQIIGSLRESLDVVRSQDTRDREEKVRLMRPRAAEADESDGHDATRLYQS